MIGNLTVDRVAGGPPRVGGAVYYAGRAAARLEADVALVTRCAETDRAACLTPLLSLGLPVTWCAARTTAEFSFHYEGDHRVMRMEAIGDPWLPEDIGGWAAPGLADSRWIHVGALARSDFATETLATLAGGERRVLVDAQGLVRRAVTGPLVRDGELDPSCLTHLTVLKLNEHEARILAGGVDPDDLRRLDVPEVVLTLGSSGSLVVTTDRHERIVAEPVAGDVDPTGAGDSFSLAYLLARAAGAEPVESARRASTVVSDLLAAR